MRSKMKYVPLFIVAALACLIFWYFLGFTTKWPAAAHLADAE